MNPISHFFKRKEHSNNDEGDEDYFDQHQHHQSLLVNDFLNSSSSSPLHNSNNNNNSSRSSNLRFSTIHNDLFTNNLNHNNNNINNNLNSDGRQYIFSAKVMNILGNILAIVTLLSFAILVPWITAHAMIYDEARPDFAAFYSAGAFVLITVAMSTKLIYNHLTHWYAPDVQKYVVRILYMVPIYSIQSWLSLRFHNARIYIDTMRDLYEAYVIQSFLYYLMELLGGEDTLSQILQDKDRHYGDHPPFPKWIFPSWEMGYDFMIRCKYGVLQYVVAKILATLITATLEPIGMFNEGEFDWTKGYVYVSFIINGSQMWALYCLVKFYHATSENLCHPTNWHPLGKFLCIKGVVFFTWWQGVLIAALKNRGLINNIGNWDKDDVANGVQDYLICVEMFCFAIAHAFTFTHSEYLPSHLSANGSGTSSVTHGNIQRRSFGEEDDDSDFGPPVIRTLETPMGFRDAFWSSTLPNETFDDIKRTIGTSRSSDQLHNQSTEVGTLRYVSMTQAESI